MSMGAKAKQEEVARKMGYQSGPAKDGTLSNTSGVNRIALNDILK